MFHRIPIPVALLVAALAFAALLPLQDAINGIKRDQHITEVSPFEALEPGQFVGSVLIGGFRMVAIDVLWWRYIKRLDERDYFELRALADVIVKLQPHFEEVWLFHGWMLGTNVAALESRPDDRWKWVEQGIQFFQNGQRKNPESWRIALFGTGWAYYHRFVIMAETEPELTKYLNARLEKATEINPRGLTALELALEQFELAAAQEGHWIAADFRVTQVLGHLIAKAKDEAELRALAKRAEDRIEHIRREHGDRIAKDTLEGTAIAPTRALIEMRARELGLAPR